jgi:putative endonuclease
MERRFFVYIMTNASNTVLYTGVTNDLRARAWSHRSGFGSKFTRRYKCVKLVYYEVFDDAYRAIAREKQIKAGSRAAKIALVDGMNPAWKDLYDVL